MQADFSSNFAEFGGLAHIDCVIFKQFMKSLKSKFFLLCLLVFIVRDGITGELKVDINRGDSKNTLSATATGYVRWATSTDGSSTTSTGTAPITQSFSVTNDDSTVSTVTVSLAMT